MELNWKSSSGIYLKCRWGGEIKNVAVLIGIAVNENGCCAIIGAAEGMKEDHDSWHEFLVWMKSRGLKGGMGSTDYW